MRMRPLAAMLATLSGCTGSYAPAHEPGAGGKSDQLCPSSDPECAREIVASYVPSCKPGCPDPACTSGTEIQTMTSFRGQLYAGTTQWMESETCIYPGSSSAQVLRLSSASGTWTAMPPLPEVHGLCDSGQAAWEQVNHLVVARFERQPDGTLLASTMPNEDGGCPGLQGTVFYLDERGDWVDTELGARLAGFYGDAQSEVRYMAVYADGTAACPADRPCVFAFVNRRKSWEHGPSVWRGRYDPSDPACRLICWDGAPEVELEGGSQPIAARIVSAFASGSQGIYFGTSVDKMKRGDCTVPSSNACPRAALFARDSAGHWAAIWRGRPHDRPGADLAVRGIAGWDAADAAPALWWVTIPRGNVYRIDGAADGAAEVVHEARLMDLMPTPCSAVYPYQLYLHQPSPSDVPSLVVASQTCTANPRNSFARLLTRPIGACADWTVTELREIANDRSTERVNESSIRWIETSPFDPSDLFLGTTDMNSGSGSLTARIYRTAAPTPACAE